MPSPLKVSGVFCVVASLGTIENEASGTHQMSVASFVDESVVFEVVEKSTLRVKGVRFVELQRVLNMLTEKGMGIEGG